MVIRKRPKVCINPKRVKGDGKDTTVVKPWAIAMTERHFGSSPLHIGQRIMHKKQGLVKITSGQYWGTYGISNFWYWKKVLPDGTLDKKEYCGYGTSDEFVFEDDEEP